MDNQKSNADMPGKPRESAEEVRAREEKKKRELWDMFRRGLISAIAFAQGTGEKVRHRAIGRVYSKYSYKELLEMRLRGTPVKNPKQAAQMNAMHDSWYQKKFGEAPAAY